LAESAGAASAGSSARFDKWESTFQGVGSQNRSPQQGGLLQAATGTKTNERKRPRKNGLDMSTLRGNASIRQGDDVIVLPGGARTPGADWRVRVVIPTLDEGAELGRVLDSVITQEGPLEIVVVDAGSSDSTMEIARNRGASVVETTPCRGGQLTMGARHKTGTHPDAFLFLHADTLLPEGALSSIRMALTQDNVVGGRFRAGFDYRHPLLDAAAWMTRWPSRWAAYGDQGFFVSQRAFESAGGFEAIPLFEDVRFYKQLCKVGKVRVLDKKVVTSGRRFRSRVARQFLINGALMVGHLLGAKPETLSKLYSRL
jgi:rSAM/selenodomain-associated transferase 2